MYRLNLSLMGASASEWADQQIGEMIIEAIGEVVGSDQSADNKEKMITALIRRQNAFLTKPGLTGYGIVQSIFSMKMK